MALDPADFTDVVLQAINEGGANGTTTFVDQSSYSEAIHTVGANTQWTNAITIGGQNVMTTGNTALDNSGFIGAGHGGSVRMNPQGQDFCIEWAGHLSAYRDTTYGRSVIFSLGIATVHNCLEIAFFDGSTYAGAGVRGIGLLASTDPNPGQNIWDIFGNDADGGNGRYLDITDDVPDDTTYYYKLTKVGSLWTQRLYRLSDSHLWTVNATVAASLGDITDLSYHLPGEDGVHAVNIGSNGGIGNDEVFLGYSTFVRMTIGASVAAMDMDGIPNFPYGSGGAAFNPAWASNSNSVIQ